MADYVSDVEYNDQILTNVDYCYRVCDVPQTFKETMTSNESQMWAKAMEEEINSLQENNTFILATLPEGKHSVGGRWVYVFKRWMRPSTSRPDLLLKITKRFFFPTANITSIQTLMQMAALYDLDLHQMDVKIRILTSSDCL